MPDRAKFHVLITDIDWPSIEPEAEVLARIGAEVILAESGSEAELSKLVGNADAILTSRARVSASVIDAGTKLQVIAKYGIGVDNIAVEEATKLGIPVANVLTYCLDEVSDHAMALILACARQVCKYDAGMHAGVWQTKIDRPLFRLRGSTLGIIGFGSIGRALAPKAKAFGMRVLVFDPWVDAQSVASEQCEKTGLDALLSQADYVSVHVPLNESTKGMIDRARLCQMKPTAFLVNTARGGIVDQDSLVWAVQNGRIAGAALDVFVPEPIPPTHPLLGLSNVITTPHVAFYSEESLLDLEIKTAESVVAVLSGKRPASVVNPEVFDLPRWRHLT